MDDTARRIESIRDRIRLAADRAGRNSDDVELVAVTKTVPPDRIIPAIHSGIRAFGESYIQEAMEKIDTLSDQAVSWHFIGHLQSNKAKYAVRYFDLIHSVDSEKLALEIDREAGKRKVIQRILVQVNIAGETSKSGISEEEAIALVRSISRLEHLRVEGLMTIPPFFDDPERARPFFRALAGLGKEISAAGFPRVSMSTLSMGMTGDFEAAVEEGATLVRIGTALFGERQ